MRCGMSKCIRDMSLGKLETLSAGHIPDFYRYFKKFVDGL